jgi:hypothetical protein
MCKAGNNYNGVKFFIDFLVEKYEDELETNDLNPNIPYPHINETEIPF